MPRQSKRDSTPTVADLRMEESCRVSPVCGVDEVGRGPWAGPLVAGAAILTDPGAVPGLADSKALSATRREVLAAALAERALTGLGIVTVPEIDALGLTAANDLAMARAVEALAVRPAFALVDGRRVPFGLPCPARALIGGDASSLSIAAASIVAKVARDAMMDTLAARWPGYGWETNRGYGTAAHRAGLAALGVCPEHRRSFKPIREMLSQEHAIES